MKRYERIIDACNRLRESDGWREHLRDGATLDDPTIWIGPILHEIEDAAARGLEIELHGHGPAEYVPYHPARNGL
jgi:hypothetical protein